MNDTIRAILDRRSIRGFTPDPLTPVQLETLSQVALASPSAMNQQPWLFHFVTDQAVISRISASAVDFFRSSGNQAVLDRIASRHASIFYGAPLVVFISMSKECQKNTMNGVDAGIAAENLVIAAQSMGLGSCIIGMAAVAFSGEDSAGIAGLIDMPESNAFMISIAIGRPAMSKDAHEQNPEKVKWIG